MKIFAPVSIGNFSVGFDLLGLAIAPVSGELLGDVVTIETSEENVLECSGDYARFLPQDASKNLVELARVMFDKKLLASGMTALPVKLHLEKRLPVGSGLGSSSSSAVAALFALNRFYKDFFSIEDILEMAGELEGSVSGSVHYDNVAPCLLGGLQLMTGVNFPLCVSVPFPGSWELVVSYPGIKVSTQEAREILPQNYPKHTAIRFAQNLSVFVHALHNDDEELAASVLFDVIAEPHRKKLIPGFDSYKDFAKSVGAIGFGISGSGSTVFAITNKREVSQRIQKYALNTFCKEGGFSHICRVDSIGAREIEDIMDSNSNNEGG